MANGRAKIARSAAHGGGGGGGGGGGFYIPVRSDLAARGPAGLMAPGEAASESVRRVRAASAAESAVMEYSSGKFGDVAPAVLPAAAGAPGRAVDGYDPYADTEQLQEMEVANKQWGDELVVSAVERDFADAVRRASLEERERQRMAAHAGGGGGGGGPGGFVQPDLLHDHRFVMKHINHRHAHFIPPIPPGVIETDGPARLRAGHIGSAAELASATQSFRTSEYLMCGQFVDSAEAHGRGHPPVGDHAELQRQIAALFFRRLCDVPQHENLENYLHSHTNCLSPVELVTGTPGASLVCTAIDTAAGRFTFVVRIDVSHIFYAAITCDSPTHLPPPAGAAPAAAGGHPVPVPAPFPDPSLGPEMVDTYVEGEREPIYSAWVGATGPAESLGYACDDHFVTVRFSPHDTSGLDARRMEHVLSSDPSGDAHHRSTRVQHDMMRALSSAVKTSDTAVAAAREAERAMVGRAAAAAHDSIYIPPAPAAAPDHPYSSAAAAGGGDGMDEALPPAYAGAAAGYGGGGGGSAAAAAAADPLDADVASVVFGSEHIIRSVREEAQPAREAAAQSLYGRRKMVRVRQQHGGEDGPERYRTEAALHAKRWWNRHVIRPTSAQDEGKLVFRVLRCVYFNCGCPARELRGDSTLYL